MPDDSTIGLEEQKKLRLLVELREKRDTDAAAAEASEKAYREHEADVWMALDESPLTGAIKIDLGEPYGVVTFRYRETYYGRILDKEATT